MQENEIYEKIIDDFFNKHKNYTIYDLHKIRDYVKSYFDNIDNGLNENINVDGFFVNLPNTINNVKENLNVEGGYYLYTANNLYYNIIMKIIELNELQTTNKLIECVKYAYDIRKYKKALGFDTTKYKFMVNILYGIMGWIEFYTKKPKNELITFEEYFKQITSIFKNDNVVYGNVDVYITKEPIESEYLNFYEFGGYYKTLEDLNNKNFIGGYFKKLCDRYAGSSNK